MHPAQHIKSRAVFFLDSVGLRQTISSPVLYLEFVLNKKLPLRLNKEIIFCLSLLPNTEQKIYIHGNYICDIMNVLITYKFIETKIIMTHLYRISDAR